MKYDDYDEDRPEGPGMLASCAVILLGMFVGFALGWFLKGCP
ncbi:hypothetical protein DFR41_104254 [Pseudacidovorax intermedius]|uniref:Uncharacterized protein n=1 Tax=Pseudacidovorax intermedius TaxID=433924 RepID=A0A370FFK9_9BURK|nr:hypothetical protein [Pseudacidovorax intermedius]RDI25197.1 hypothetical protein DFR41_104254 [Pseudacidovorax intermedius]